MSKLSMVSRYRRRLFYNFFFLFVAFAIAIGTFQFNREKQYRVAQLENSLKIYINLVNDFILSNNLSQANNFKALDSLVVIIPDTEIRITVINTKGIVMYDSFVDDYHELENHLNRIEIQESLVKQTGNSIRHSSSTQSDFYYCALKFPSYFVRAALPYNIKVENALKVDSIFIYFIVLLFFVAVLILVFLSDKLGKSISQLQSFAKKAARGEMVDVDIEFPNNELGSIGKQIVRVYSNLAETKDELSAEREKLFRHLQIAHEGIAVFSKEKKQLLANNHFVQFLNTLSDESAVTPSNFFSLNDLKPINDFIDEQLNKTMRDEATDLSSNIITLNKNGKYYIIQAIVFNDSSFEVSINDVTKLEKEKKLKQEMTSNIAHELKTPVSSILGYLETILTQKVDDERRNFFLERSYIQSQRLSALIQDISLLNKLGESSALFETELITVKDVVYVAIDDLKLKIDERNISVSLDIPDNLQINGNRSIFYSVWRNLIENAINYAGEGISLRVKKYLEDDNFIYFSFSDSGIGIPEEHLSRIFERFYRIDKGRSRSMGGTGLGLAIVKNGVLFHGGEISVKNLKSGGLEYIFSIAKA